MVRRAVCACVCVCLGVLLRMPGCPWCGGTVCCGDSRGPLGRLAARKRAGDEATAAKEELAAARRQVKQLEVRLEPLRWVGGYQRTSTSTSACSLTTWCLCGQAQMNALQRLASRAATSEQQVRTQAKLHKQEVERLAAQHRSELESTVKRVEAEASVVIDELRERLRRRDTVRAWALCVPRSTPGGVQL